jgi:hypothetical protein
MAISPQLLSFPDSCWLIACIIIIVHQSPLQNLKKVVTLSESGGQATFRRVGHAAYNITQ